jgi:carbamoyl-phosphate synthase large subunit
MSKIKVLVTGAGCGVGQSIIKSLKISKLNVDIFAADINEFSSALYRNKSFVIPKVENRGSLKWFIQFLKKIKINILFIGSELEIEFFSKNKKIIEKKTNVIICVSNFESVKIFNDKFLTAKFFTEHEIYSPLTIAVSKKNIQKQLKKFKYPLMLKDSLGTSSRNVYLIKSEISLKEKLGSLKNPLIQEFLGKKNIGNIFEEEYTCGLFYSKNKEIFGPIMFQRKLKYGTSWVLTTVKNKKLKQTVLNIGSKINAKGPINIQLRKHKNKFVPFEINPRFSGTTSVRAALGFNEPEMFIKNYYLNLKLKHKQIQHSVVFRYFEEVFLNKVSIGKLKNNFNKGKIKNWS